METVVLAFVPPHDALHCRLRRLLIRLCSSHSCFKSDRFFCWMGPVPFDALEPIPGAPWQGRFGPPVKKRNGLYVVIDGKQYVDYIERWNGPKLEQYPPAKKYLEDLAANSRSRYSRVVYRFALPKKAIA